MDTELGRRTIKLGPVRLEVDHGPRIVVGLQADEGRGEPCGLAQLDLLGEVLRDETLNEAHRLGVLFEQGHMTLPL